MKKTKRLENLEKLEKGIVKPEASKTHRLEFGKLLDIGTYARIGEYLGLAKTEPEETRSILKESSKKKQGKLIGANVRPILNAIRKGLNQGELEELLDYELSHKKRKTVINAIKKELESEESKLETLLGAKVKPILEAIRKEKLSESELEELLDYELSHKKRKTVINAITSKKKPKKRGRKKKTTERTHLKRVSLEPAEEWRGGIDSHSIEIAEVGEEKLVAEIIETEEEKREGLFSRIVRKVKNFFGIIEDEPEEELEETNKGVIRIGATDTVHAVETDAPEEKHQTPLPAPEPKKVEEKIPEETDDSIVTGIDKLFSLIGENEKVALEDAAKKLSVTKKKAEEWAKILEDQELIDIHYPAVGEPELTQKVKTKGGSHEVKGD